MTWSSVDLAHHCLADRIRTSVLVAAVQASVSAGDRVLDLGAGTGVLGLAALHSGAASVVAVEEDRIAASYLRRVAAELPGRFEVIEASVEDLGSGEPYDLVLAELIDTWLMEEQFVAGLRHCVDRGLVGESTTVLPSEYAWVFEIGDINPDRMPFGIQFPFYEWPQYADPSLWNVSQFSPSQSTILDRRTARQMLDGEQLFQVSWEPPKQTAFDAVRLSGLLWPCPGGDPIGATPSMNASIVLPLSRSFGGAKHIEVRFVPSGGIGSLSIMIDGTDALPWQMVGSTC